ncbi:MAG: TIGR03084 family metal-binding protein [Acidimicrobiales bacterium]
MSDDAAHTPHRKVLADLGAEVDDLAGLLESLPEGSWDAATPAPGWEVRDQVAHLVMFDERCMWSIADPDRFLADRTALGEPGRYGTIHGDYRNLAPADLMDRWRRGAHSLRAAGEATDPRGRCSWYGPSMSATSMLTARLMETWAHGQDVVDALRLHRTPTARLRHVAHIAVNARPFSFVANGREAPVDDVRVELRAPDGDTWTWGDSATDSVRGDALGFCLAATQRRHPDDCGLETRGVLAREWVSIIQAFAGPPGEGRRPGQFD